VEPQKPNALQHAPGLHTAPPADAPHAVTGELLTEGVLLSDVDGVKDIVGVLVAVTLVVGVTDAVTLIVGDRVGVMDGVGDGVAEKQKPNAVWQPVSMEQ
jgi:hypothetical protein